MSLRFRTKFLAYLVILHLGFLGLGFLILTVRPVLFFILEAGFAVSLVLGIRLVRSFFESLELLGTGTLFLEEKDFTIKFQPGSHAETNRLIRVYNDMVDRLKNERLRQLEQNYFLDKIMTASPTGILTLDFDRRIDFVNPAAESMLNRPKRELAGKTLAELETRFADSLGALELGQSAVFPLSGGRRIKCRKSEFYDRGFSRPFLILEELTEELRRSEKQAYGKLIRMMSHEVNNSIGSVNSLLHACLHYKTQLTPSDREDFETALTVAISRTAQLNEFMRGFADVIRLPEPRRSPADVREILENVAALMKPEFQNRNITLEWRHESELAPVSLDRIQMEQVFVNILKNALEAAERDGLVRIRLGTVQNRTFVAVENSGPGIPPEHQAKLFTPFFTTKENGQGIGLTLVQDILTRHNFSFALESKDGEPTRFTVRFT